MRQSTPSLGGQRVNTSFSNITPIEINNTEKSHLSLNKRKIEFNSESKIKKPKSDDGKRKVIADDSPQDFNNSEDDLFLCNLFCETNVYDQCESKIKRSLSEDIFLLPDDSAFDKINVSDVGYRVDNKSCEDVNGVLDFFNETDECFPNHNKSKLSDALKNKLLQNASNVAVEATKSTGWTQLQNSSNEFMSLENSHFNELGPFYGLPIMVKQLIESLKGINDLYEWQKECLMLPAIKERKNLIYSLPTSGGKTLVAEILILRELLCYKKNVIFILPFVAIVQEKVRSLSPLAIELDFLVEEYAAGKGSLPPRKRRKKQSILVCTIEKALAVIQSLIETQRLHEVGLVVVDELHLLSEGSGRGASLETALSYLIYNQENIHIVGMSATIGNLNEISKFLKAETYTGNFRPVELTEYVKCGENIYRIDWTQDDALVPFRTLPSSFSSSDPDGITTLVQEVCPEDSVLVFCPTKKNCENVASLLCRNLPRKVLEHRASDKKGLIEMLTSEFNGRVCPILRESLRYGVAYHHSGLTADERKVLEDAYREGVLCCICCTSTLAAGVNLPAKRVILRAPYVGRDFISLSKYKQMVGRAGRAGLESCGESFLICQSNDTTKVNDLLKSKMDESMSAITVENCKDIVLSVVGLGVAVTRQTIQKFLGHTLLNVQSEKLKVNVKKITDECIASLYKSGALRVNKDNAKIVVKNAITGFDDGMKTNKSLSELSKLDVTVANVPEQKTERKLQINNTTELSISRIGRAAMKGCMSLPTALKLYSDLLKAESSLVLLCSLHILYLVTPYQLPDHITPNYSVYFDVYMQLSEKEQHAAKVIGLPENQVSKLAMGQKPKNVSDEVLSRFYVTLIINELWKQRSVWEVAAVFKVPRGMVQNMMSSASSFSWNVLRFCEEMDELWSVKAILAEFIPRLAHCCEAELLPLMDLPAIKRVRARQLYNAGFKSLQHIAKANAKELADAVSYLPIRAANQIIAAAKMQLLEKVENLKDEADEVLEHLGKELLL